MVEVGQDLFDHELAAAIRIRHRRGVLLVQRQVLRGAIDGGRGAEDELAHTFVLHGTQQYQGAVDVVVVVVHGLCDGFAYGLLARKVHHAVNAVLFQCGFQCLLIAHIALNHRDGATSDAFHTLHSFGVAVAEVVKNHDPTAMANQFDGGMAADITGAACEQGFHHREFSGLSIEKALG